MFDVHNYMVGREILRNYRFKLMALKVVWKGDDDDDDVVDDQRRSRIITLTCWIYEWMSWGFDASVFVFFSRFSWEIHRHSTWKLRLEIKVNFHHERERIETPKKFLEATFGHKLVPARERWVLHNIPSDENEPGLCMWCVCSMFTLWTWYESMLVLKRSLLWLHHPSLLLFENAIYKQVILLRCTFRALVDV